MQNRFGLLVTDVMPIYVIMPRYSHNYSLFYQLLDSNSFTHHNTYAILREATSETYGPRGLFSIIQVSNLFYFAIFTFNLYHKNTKNIYLIMIISISLSQVTVNGLTTPLSRWLQGSYLFVQVCGI